VDDWGGFMAVLVGNAGNIEGGRSTLGVLNWLGAKLNYFAHLVRSNTRLGARANIEQHYDAGNDMYRLFLDSSMTYSSGMYLPGECPCTSRDVGK
jgi:cyclopropane-fatty-acyl-phospholipid synthase